MNLVSKLGALSARAPHAAFRPRLFSLSNADHRLEVEALLDAGHIRDVYDRFLDQAAELCATRSPKNRLRGEALSEAVKVWLGSRAPDEIGTWVYYPWSHRLVHVLEAADYRELRSSRNRYKITSEEQALLATKRIGVVGLSVGQACAMTAALEGVGGFFRLADFDELALSNMNRLRTGVHQIGTNKCILAAREMFEINPYVEVEILTQGLSDENTDLFLTEGGKLDLVIEECDDLFTKIFVRERAKAHGIAVIMETNDRGMLDIERFDTEPDRPILHNLLQGFSAETLRGLSPGQKVGIILRLIGPDAIKGRLSASLLEVDQTTTSWPQLASGTMLGGAVTTDVARRILLGEHRNSGRYFVDIESLVKDGREVPIAVDHVMEGVLGRTPITPPPSPKLARPSEKPRVSRDDIRRLVEFAVLAPSGGNAQPWQFVARGARIRCSVSASEGRTLLDYKRYASYVALGAAVENMVLAAPAMGLSAEVIAADGAWDVMLRVETASGEVDPLVSMITERVTNRRLGTGEPLPPHVQGRLAEAAKERGAELFTLTDRAAMTELGDVVGQNDRLLFLSKRLNEEMSAELRWTAEDAVSSRNGLDVLTLDVSPPELAMVRIATNWKAMEFLARIGGGQALTGGLKRAVATSSAVSLLVCPGTDENAYFQGGRALARVWLEATALGIAFQPIAPILYLFARQMRGGGRGLEPWVQEALRGLRERFSRVFPVSDEKAEILLFRLSLAPRPTARSLRRAVHDVLTFE